MPLRGRLVLLAIVSSLLDVVCGCAVDQGGARSRPEGAGRLALELRLNSSAAIETVLATLTSPALVSPVERPIAVAADSATPSAFFGGLPSGPYQIELSAESVDGKVSCRGFASFTIVARQVAQVIVPLACKNDEVRGHSIVTARINVCPIMTHLFAGPVIVDDRDPVTVEIEVSDADADPISYEWTATRGAFDDPSAPATLYRCDGSGTAKLTIRATDGGDCPVESEFHVSCIPGFCGDREVRGEEDCDPPNGATCNSECLAIPVACGDGLVQPGEECEPPGSSTCDESCRIVGPGCGNGAVEPALGEECDAPGDPYCDDECKFVFTFNFCPEILFYVVTPTSAVLGDAVFAFVEAVDDDDDPLIYLWSSPSGTWSNAAAASTEFTCTASGIVPLTITVDDGRGCPASEVIPFSCL